MNFIENFLASLEELNSYRFLRVGEDYDDVECSGWYSGDPFDLTLARSISFNANENTSTEIS